MNLTYLLCAWLAATPAPSKPAAAPAKKAAPEASKPAASVKPAPTPVRNADEAAAADEAPAKPFRWDVPGLVGWVDASEPQVSNGVPMALQMARSKRTVDELVQHFANEFEEAGFYIPPDSVQASPVAEPMLTALDTEKLIAYTVVFQANPDKTTTLVLGTSFLSQYNPAQQQVPWAPMMPGAEQVMLTELEGAQSVAFAVRVPESKVLAFYRAELKQAGFVEKEPGLFRRGQEQLKLFTKQEGEVLMVGINRRLGVEDESL